MAKRFVTKKTLRIPTIFLCALVSCSLFALIFSACNDAQPPVQDEATYYGISLEYSENKIVASQEVMYKSPATLSFLLFNLYPNALGDDSKIDILSAQINRQTVDFEIYGQNDEFLKLPCSLNAEDVCTASFEYEVTIKKSNSRLGITDTGVANLTCFYPILAKYENGFREDVYTQTGDPFYQDIASYFVTMTCDEGLQVATSGVVDSIDRSDGRQTLSIIAENVRSFGMVVGNMQFVKSSVNIGDRAVDVNYYYTDDIDCEQSMRRICDSLTLFSSAFGDYPYSSYTVAQSDLDGAGGMEYGAFAIVSPTIYREDYLDSITHETAHQWWYGVVGNDQINDAWLDEGLCEFCTYYFHYLNGDRTTFQSSMARLTQDYTAFDSQKVASTNYTMNKPLSSYSSNDEYVAMVYLKGAMLFDLIHNIVGDEKFLSALSHYYESNKFGIATQDSLVSAFKTQGYNFESIIDSWVKDKAPM